MERIGRGHGSGLIDQSQDRARFALFNTVAGLGHTTPARLTDSRLRGRADRDVTLVLVDRVTFVTRLVAAAFVILERVSRHVGHPEDTGRHQSGELVVGVIAAIARSRNVARETVPSAERLLLLLSDRADVLHDVARRQVLRVARTTTRGERARRRPEPSSGDHVRHRGRVWRQGLDRGVGLTGKRLCGWVLVGIWDSWCPYRPGG